MGPDKTTTDLAVPWPLLDNLGQSPYIYMYVCMYFFGFAGSLLCRFFSERTALVMVEDDD